MSEPDRAEPPPLTEDERLWALRRATNSVEGAKERWAKRVRDGLTDDQLAEALRYELGHMGSSSKDDVGVTYHGNELKIWADRCIGSTRAKPILEGRDTVTFARRVYGIRLASPSSSGAIWESVSPG
jgi:hypothetical protein